MTSVIQEILASYHPLLLEQTKAVKLMNRIDTKYLTSADVAIQLLRDLQESYFVLEIESQRIGAYNTLYFDTTDKQMFYSHVTDRLPRYKVRERSYSQNSSKFLEVKHKNNKERTSKKRMLIEEDQTQTNPWVAKHITFQPNELAPSLYVSFERITLIDHKKTERVTIDFNLRFRAPSGNTTPLYDRIAIIELKQSKRADSLVKKYLRSKKIRPTNVSKYCTGILLTQSETNYKRYKSKIAQFIKTQSS